MPIATSFRADLIVLNMDVCGIGSLLGAAGLDTGLRLRAGHRCPFESVVFSRKYRGVIGLLRRPRTSRRRRWRFPIRRTSRVPRSTAPERPNPWSRRTGRVHSTSPLALPGRPFDTAVHHLLEADGRLRPRQHCRRAPLCCRRSTACCRNSPQAIRPCTASRHRGPNRPSPTRRLLLLCNSIRKVASRRSRLGEFASAASSFSR